MRRFLAWLCSLSLIFCVVSGVALGAEIPNIEDMGIDPWADFEMISQHMGGSQPTPSPEVYDLEDDTGIMLLSDVTNPSWQLRMSGFASNGTYETQNSDGDDEWLDWDGVSVLDTATYPVKSGSQLGSGRLSALQPTPGFRSSAVFQTLAISRLPYWTGRPPIRNNEWLVSRDTTLYYSAGSMIFDVVDWEEVPNCSSIQLIDAGFYVSWALEHYESFDVIDPNQPTNITVDNLNPQLCAGGEVVDVHLLINGQDVGAIPCDIVNSQTTTLFHSRITIPDAVVQFDEQLVRSVSFSVNVGPLGYHGSNPDALGGFGIHPYGGNRSTMVLDTFRIYSGTDPNTENTGLLRSIIDFLKSIVTGITELPGKIANAIIEGLKSLFIPDEDFLAQWKEEFFTMLKTKFGFIYQCFEFLGDFFNDFIRGWGDTENYTFKFPTIEFTIEGTTYTVIQEQVVSLDNAVMDVLRPFAGTVVSIVTVLAFIHTMEDMFIAIISGWSYFSFMERRGEAEENGNTRNSEQGGNE